MHNLIEALKKLIIKAGDIALMRRNSGIIISCKQDNSPVTNADIEISEFIYKGLKNLTPNIPVICEEREIDDIYDGAFWLVDPIDGTRSYIKNEDSYTINIAFIQNRLPVIGLIYQPSVAKLYYTDANNNLRIEKSNIEEKFEPLAKNHYSAVISSHLANSATREFLEKYLITEITTIASSIKLCLIAEGKADIYPRFGTSMEWDIAAGHALIKASGGNIIDLDGNELIYKKKNFQNPYFHAYSSNWLERKFG